MLDFLISLAVGLLPALGAVIGGAIAESTRAPKWVVGVALHAAAGIAIAVVSVNLMPRILEHTPIWLAALAFLAGATFSVLLAHAVKRVQDRADTKGSTGAWMVYMAVAADLFSDGLMTGVGSAISGGLGLLLGLSQLVGNIPGGFGAVATFRNEGVEKKTRLIFAASFALPILVGAGLGFVVLRDVGADIQNAALAFVVGVLLLATVEDTLPQADEPTPPRPISTAAFALGFVFFMLLASFIS